ncbi:alpha/beta hydrolase-fold protein [Spirosoma luteum]|uniref:alpha/beta hydrolase-fold protein n=1 Tax=Spirosoma luteum TaxID=431553 RepID=UPI000A061B04|nr:alpha/beta hydrolase-fold protein [Spirosoma luteum]
MKTLMCCCILFFHILFVRAQENNSFVTGFKKSISSKVLGQQRDVWIHSPTGNNVSKVTGNEGYPVIYLLDGETNFNTVVSITDYMSEVGLCPPMVIVGIIHPNRMKDLTSGTDKEYPGFVGTGNKFMAYVETELMPFVESNYPTTPYKIFIGHSVGGLTVINALIHQPNLFNAYISLDGALWWDDQRIVKEGELILKNKNFKGKTLFMGLANRMEKGVDTLAVQKDTSDNTVLIRSNLKLIKYIAQSKNNELRFKHKYYEDDDHSSVRMVGEYDALRFIFNFYKFKIYDSDLDNPNVRLDSLLIEHYKNISKEMGYVVKPNESQTNNLGYRMLSQKLFDKAEHLFKLNIDNYPENANCYDSMGDLYLAKKDRMNAIKNFKKALSIKEIPETKQKLKNLLEEND